MLKFFAILLSCALLPTVQATPKDSFEYYLKAGKAEFDKHPTVQDFERACAALERAIKLRPKNAEAHYFLGYAYSRLNINASNALSKTSLSLTLKSSAALEKVNRLAPKYKGQMLVLDPYSKLTAEWGSLAIRYMYENKRDSAKWAFTEGRLRGGFGEFYLGINRVILDQCDFGAVLLSSGDNSTFPLWYLQVVEGYRRDVAVVDVNLLESDWYAPWLVKTGTAEFGHKAEQLEVFQTRVWYDTTVNIGNHSWKIRPSQPTHFFRGEQLMVELVMANWRKNAIYFTPGFSEKNFLGMGELVYDLELLKVFRGQDLYMGEALDQFAKLRDMLSTVKYVNRKSEMEVRYVSLLRYQALSALRRFLLMKEYQGAKRLQEMIDYHIKTADFPFQNSEEKEFADQLRKWTNARSN